MFFRMSATTAATSWLLLLAVPSVSGVAAHQAATPPTTTTTVIDFNDLAPGTVVQSLLDDNDIQVHTLRRVGRHFRRAAVTYVKGQAMVFDSTHPTGGDVDLGTPHQSYGGPGIGRGGRIGERFPNDKARGNVLIVSEDENAVNPDDNQYGGILTFDFTTPRRVDSFGLLDSEEGVTVRVFASDRNATIVDAEDAGNNSFQLISVNVDRVYRMVIDMHGSGAITHFVLDGVGCPIAGDPATDSPTLEPTTLPTTVPTSAPTSSPTVSESEHPSASPTLSPTATPVQSPTAMPTTYPTVSPTPYPTFETPTLAPTKTECWSSKTKKVDFEKHTVGGKQISTLGFDTSVSGRRFGDDGDEKLAAIVMDSSRNDAKNLGSPNETFGGPGKGAGGEKGEKFENKQDRGLVLIISENDDRNHPVIAEDGGYFTFKFKVPLTVESVGLLNNVDGAEFEVTLVDGQTITVDHKERGKNSFEEVAIGIPMATKMKVKVFGPTAITHLELTNPLVTCNK